MGEKSGHPHCTVTSSPLALSCIVFSRIDMSNLSKPVKIYPLPHMYVVKDLVPVSALCMYIVCIRIYVYQGFSNSSLNCNCDIFYMDIHVHVCKP